VVRVTNAGLTEDNVSQTLSGIGQRLRQIRLERGISLRELARRLDLSPNAVSKIETGKMRPSLRTLHALIAEFELSVDEVFDEHPSPSSHERSVADVGTITIERAHDRPAMSLNSHVELGRLSSLADNVELVEATYAPGGSSDPSALGPSDEQALGYVVLSGTLRVVVGSERFVLSAGDSINLPSRTPHQLFNDGPEHARAMWVMPGRSGPNLGLEAHGQVAP
jgi:transcriptional regulator with XRE-family HTH domain